MKNRYFILRHGQSHPNVQGIILSHLGDGKKEDHTLTAEGESDVRASVARAKESGMLDCDVLIISSPFSRCKKTAEIAKEELAANQEIVFDERLKERWFGRWEKTSNANYQKVWDGDRVDPGHQAAEVESAHDVQQRTLSLLRELEETHEGKTILLVSHGDALQIMQTGANGQSAALHREMPHLETAQIRQLLMG